MITSNQDDNASEHAEVSTADPRQSSVQEYAHDENVSSESSNEELSNDGNQEQQSLSTGHFEEEQLGNDELVNEQMNGGQPDNERLVSEHQQSQVAGNQDVSAEYIATERPHSAHVSESIAAASRPQHSEIDGQSPISLRPSNASRYSSNSSSSEPQSHGLSRRPWSPIWLRKPVLLGFFILYVGMIAAVAALYQVSKNRHGIASQVKKNQYSWTYGPTAALVFVGSLWRQVDHLCKLLLPWQNLKAGSQASHSLLLDYISPMTPVGLWTACRNRHWPVAASVTVFLLLKLAEILSTGLLVLQPTKLVQEQVPFSPSARFTADKFNDSSISEYSLQAFQGIRTYRLPYPRGVIDDLVVQYFQQQSGSASHNDSTITADVLGFRPNYNCEAVTPSQPYLAEGNLQWSDVYAEQFLVNVTTPTCRLNKVRVAHGASSEELLPENTSQTYQAYWQNITCNDGVDNSQQYVPSGPDNGDHRILMTVADVHWTTPPPDDSQYSGPPSGSRGPGYSPATFYDYSIRNISAVLCKSVYSIDEYTVSFQGQGPSLSMTAKLRNGTATTLKGFTDADLSKALRSAGREANVTQLLYASNQKSIQEEVDPYFRLMMNSNKSPSLASFMDPGFLEDTGCSTLNGVSVLLVYDHLMQPNEHDSVVNGSVMYEGQRLVAKDLTVYLMLSTIAVLCIICLFEVFIRPEDSTPCTIGSVSALATVFASSTDLGKQLLDLGLSTKDEVSRKLSTHYYRSNFGHRFQIEAISQPCDTTTANAKLPFTKKLDPLRGLKSIMAAFATAMLPVLLIILLEILQQYSDSHKGIMALDPNQTSRVLTSYIPALLMLLVTTLYSRLEFDTAALAPFRALRAGQAIPSRSIQSHLIGKYPLHGFWLCICSRHWIPCLNIMATFVSSFLSILVSGLYAVNSISSSVSMELQQASTFNFTTNDLHKTDNDAAAITSLIEYSNLTYPRWTYDTLLFPELRLDASSKKEKIEFIDIRVPAFRPSLDCSAIPRSQISVSVSDTDRTSHSYDIGPQAWIELEANLICPNVANTTWSQKVLIDANNQEQNIGLASNLDWAFDDLGQVGFFFGDGPTGNSGFGTANTERCSGFGFSLGKAKAFKDPRSTNKAESYNASAEVDMISCSARMEKLTAEVRFEMPDFSISTTKPPRIVDKTSHFIDGGPGGHWHYSMQQFLLGLTSSSSRSIDESPIDRFTEALARGKGGRIPYSEWGNNFSKSKNTLISAANDLYATYMVQAISQNMRIPLELNTLDPIDNATTIRSTPKFPGTATTRQNRLKQNVASKIALQGVLAFMVICALITYSVQLWDRRQTKRAGNDISLPPMLLDSPCSIAATGVLLAGSKMVSPETVPEGSEWLEEKERSKIWEGRRFRMGFWDNREREGEEVVGGNFGGGDGNSNGNANNSNMSGRGEKKKRYGIDFERHDVTG